MTGTQCKLYAAGCGHVGGTYESVKFSLGFDSLNHFGYVMLSRDYAESRQWEGFVSIFLLYGIPSESSMKEVDLQVVALYNTNTQQDEGNVH